MRLDRFWLLHRNIDRLAAENDIRHLRIAAGSQSGEGATETYASLKKEMGEIAVFDEGRRAMSEAMSGAVLDSEGLREIAGLGGLTS